MDLTVNGVLRESQEEPRTLNEIAYRALRSEILRCEVKPGERLLFDALKARFQVGTSPLREAMARLASEGLITFESHKGARVAPISMADFRDLVAMRQLVECESMRRSIELGDDLWESRLVASFHYYRKATESTGAVSEEREKRHRDFHFALASACDSKRLMEMREIYYRQSERYRLLGLAFRHLQKYERDGLAEHSEIMELAIKRNADLACELLKSHLARTIDEVDFALKSMDVPAGNPAARPQGHSVW